MCLEVQCSHENIGPNFWRPLSWNKHVSKIIRWQNRLSIEMSRNRHSTDIRSVEKNPPQRQKSDSATKFSTNIRAQTSMQKIYAASNIIYMVLVVIITSFYHKCLIFIGFCKSYYLLIETAHNVFLWKMWNKNYIVLKTCKFILKQLDNSPLVFRSSNWENDGLLCSLDSHTTIVQTNCHL